MQTILPKVDMTDSKKVIVEIPELLWRQARSVAALHGITAREMVAGLLLRYVRESKEVPEEAA